VPLDYHELRKKEVNYGSGLNASGPQSGGLHNLRAPLPRLSTPEQRACGMETKHLVTETHSAVSEQIKETLS